MIRIAPGKAPELVAPPTPFQHVAPLGVGRICKTPWEGKHKKKPWDFRITAVIPHLNTPHTLPYVLNLLKLQTERPYLVIIDTGSPPGVCKQLEGLRAADVEVHYLASHAYIGGSEPVSIAMDLAMALCRSEYLFCTHADVFLRRRDFLAWLRARCDAPRPVVGYEMSPRHGTEAWRGVPSHTATMLHMPTMRRIGASWNLQRACGLCGVPKPQRGWPDTETMLGLSLQNAGIAPTLLGKHDEPEDRTYPWARAETNNERHVDDNLDHVRSLTGALLYSPERASKAQAELLDALRQARTRIATWARERG